MLAVRAALLLAGAIALGVPSARARSTVWPGSPLSLGAACVGDALVLVHADSGTVRSVDGTLCVTYTGPSPAQLRLSRCADGDARQAWRYDNASSTFQATPDAATGCVAWNTQGDVSHVDRPVSTWPCSDVQWNGRFSVAPSGVVSADCSSPSTCPPVPALCVGASTALGRVLSFSTVVRYWSVEVTRDTHLGSNESSLHTVARCAAFRAAVDAGWPGASITWAFSWMALHTSEGEYPAIRALVASYVAQRGDEMTYVPSGYFAPMYNTQAQTSADIHDALAVVSSVVGGGYRPRAVIGGFLGAQTLQDLAAVEDIHVAVATIFSQHNIDYGDGDGGSPYPYFPSREHYLKPAQGAGDFIDVVALDGWTVDLLAARRDGFAGGFNSRMGVGPIETVGRYGALLGLDEQLHATAQMFGAGAALNGGDAYVTSIWEMSLDVNVSSLTAWLSATRSLWPDAQMLTHGEFGSRWRDVHPGGNTANYSFVTSGSGIGGSDVDKELTLWLNRAFRLALLRNLSDVGSVGVAIDFTRYDNSPAAEPPAGPPFTRDWDLWGTLNWKRNSSMPLSALADADKALVHAWLPALPLE